MSIARTGKLRATRPRRRVKMYPKNHSGWKLMHYVLARITVKPEVAELAKGILVDLASKSRQDAGCMGYELFQQTEAPHVFQTVEQDRKSTRLNSSHVESSY